MNFRHFFIQILILFTLILASCSDYGKVQNGFGKASLPDGSVYKGEFRNGLFNGKGTLRSRNGSIYEGEFQDGLYNGKGKITFPDGSVFEGEFKDAIEHGNGQYISKFQTTEIEDGCEITVSKEGDKIFLARRIGMYFGSDFLEKSGRDLTYVVCSYDIDGNTLNRFCQFEDIGRVNGHKYYSERNYITTLSDGDIAVVHTFPYVIKIFSPEGVHKKTITRQNRLFQGIKMEKQKFESRELLRFVKSASVHSIFTLPEDMFMVVIYDRDYDGEEKYIYDFYTNKGHFLQSFRVDKKIDHIDHLGFVYGIINKDDIPVIIKYEMMIL